MKTNSTFEADVDSPADGVFADLSHLMAAAPRQHLADPPALVDAAVEWPAVGGLSFTDANPWPRGGLNE